MNEVETVYYGFFLNKRKITPKLQELKKGILNTFVIYFHSVGIIFFLPLRLDPYGVEAKYVSVEGPDTLGASSGTSTSSTIYKYTFFN